MMFYNSYFGQVNLNQNNSLPSKFVQSMLLHCKLMVALLFLLNLYLSCYSGHFTPPLEVDQIKLFNVKLAQSSLLTIVIIAYFSNPYVAFESEILLANLRMIAEHAEEHLLLVLYLQGASWRALASLTVMPFLSESVRLSDDQVLSLWCIDFDSSLCGIDLHLPQVRHQKTFRAFASFLWSKGLQWPFDLI